jgi:histidinol phosphatase-like enzyme (inositol monophosphatase family)
MPSSQELLDFAVQIAEDAGQIALRYFRTPLTISSKSNSRFDPVTRADMETEARLRELIAESFPEHGIVGEEHGITRGGQMKWIIDPIDGTRGFISGSPMWGMLLGLMDGDEPVLGVVHNPYLQETYYGSAAGACYRTRSGESTIHTRNTAHLADAVLYCTHPAMFDEEWSRAAFARVDAACQFSRYGADCYGYALLASGYADLVVEDSLQPYDVIPLIPLVRAAGGVISDWNGGAPLAGGRIVAAGNPALHEQALKLLQP